MPTRYRDGDTPIVEFDPALEISPFTLFRQLSEDRPPLLVDVRRGNPTGRSLEGAIPLPGAEWRPPADRPVVLFDDSGEEAPAAARRLQERGFEGVRALFGGLDLWEFALDPQVVGDRTFLVRTGPPAGDGG